ncbi:MAG: hypothetical protein J6G98_01545 [Bacilli bacterium]|nr:hypothetical protein [Bacilli bacterium]
MFNSMQQQKIYEILQKYNNDDEYRQEIESNYYNDIISLSIYEIYVLEELVRYGSKNYYNALLNAKQSDKQNIFDEYDILLKLYKNNEQFFDNDYQKYTQNDEQLSEIQKFVITLMKNTKKEKNRENYEYDEFVPMKYNSDREIKDTLLNILLGNFIGDLFNNDEILKLYPNLIDIKSHQKQPGMIATCDKDVLITLIQNNIPDVTLLETKVDEMYAKVKIDLLFKNSGEKSFEQFIVQRTNISNDEVGFDLYKNPFTKNYF